MTDRKDTGTNTTGEPTPDLQAQFDEAAIAEFAEDLKGMSLTDIDAAISEASDQIDEVEPGIDALCAKRRQMQPAEAESERPNKSFEITCERCGIDLASRADCADELGQCLGDELFDVSPFASPARADTERCDAYRGQVEESPHGGERDE